MRGKSARGYGEIFLRAGAAHWQEEKQGQCYVALAVTTAVSNGRRNPAEERRREGGWKEGNSGGVRFAGFS
jgi:hypothetical protein